MPETQGDRKEMLLNGRVALITGASRGIGRAIAISLAEAGCRVAIASRSLQASQSTAAWIKSNCGVEAIGLEADVSRFDEVRRLFLDLLRWSSGRLDILVNNAGYPMNPEIWNTPLDATPESSLPSWYAEVYGTDALGAVYCTHQAIPGMKAHGGGNILYISSTPALEGYRGTPYTMAKAAILGLMKDVAREYGKDNIRANALALGNIRTSATFDALDEKNREALAAEAPLNRWGAPEEVGKAALFLVSGLSSFVTGQVIVVDGGTVRR